MKEELETKYVLLSFSARLMDNWHQHTQSNKSAKKYVEKFNEFLIKCSTLHKEDEAQILFRFRASLRDNPRTELLARGVNELETVYALLQDLDSAMLQRVTIIGLQCLDSLPHLPNPIGLVSRLLHTGMTLRIRALNGTTETRAPISPELVPQLSATNVKIMDI